MICVGIDVSKDKSTICMITFNGEVIRKPYDINHTDEELGDLVKFIVGREEQVKVVMESTGHYHLPVLGYLKQHNIFVSVENALLIKRYASVSIRLKDYKGSDKIYEELNILSRQYNQYVSIKVKCKVQLSNLIDKVMPRINKLLQNDKLYSFTEKFWHFDNITKKSEKQFINQYNSWAKKEGYHTSDTKAQQIFALAQNGIPTLDSNAASTKMLVLESIRLLREAEVSVNKILTHILELTKQLVEFQVVRSEWSWR